MENRGFLKNVKRIFGIFFTTMAYVSASERLFTTEKELDDIANVLSNKLNQDEKEK